MPPLCPYATLFRSPARPDRLPRCCGRRAARRGLPARCGSAPAGVPGVRAALRPGHRSAAGSLDAGVPGGAAGARAGDRPAAGGGDRRCGVAHRSAALPPAGQAAGGGLLACLVAGHRPGHVHHQPGHPRRRAVRPAGAAGAPDMIERALLAAFAVLLLLAFLAPIESLRWWSRRRDEVTLGSFAHSAADDGAATQVQEARLFVVYLSGIGTVDGLSGSRRERAVLTAVAERVPDAVVAADVFPYAVENQIGRAHV